MRNAAFGIGAECRVRNDACGMTRAKCGIGNAVEDRDGSPRPGPYAKPSIRHAECRIPHDSPARIHTIPHHSYLNACAGSSREACREGYSVATKQMTIAAMMTTAKSSGRIVNGT